MGNTSVEPLEVRQLYFTLLSSGFNVLPPSPRGTQGLLSSKPLKQCPSHTIFGRAALMSLCLSQRQRLACSSWNVFFRQLAALLSSRTRSLAARHRERVARHNERLQHLHRQKAAKAGLVAAGYSGIARADGVSGLDGRGVDDGVDVDGVRVREDSLGGSVNRLGAVDGAIGTDDGGDAVATVKARSAPDDAGSCDIGEGTSLDADARHTGNTSVSTSGSNYGTSGDQTSNDFNTNSKSKDASGIDTTSSAGDPMAPLDDPPFPRKLFVILDNAEALLGEGVAGIGVGAGGSKALGNSWRGPDLLTRLARISDMISSFNGFAGAEKTKCCGCFRNTLHPHGMLCRSLIHIFIGRGSSTVWVCRELATCLLSERHSPNFLRSRALCTGEKLE